MANIEQVRNKVSSIKVKHALGKNVGDCYQPQHLINETKRIEFLFDLYNQDKGEMFGEKEKCEKKQVTFVKSKLYNSKYSKYVKGNNRKAEVKLSREED